MMKRLIFSALVFLSSCSASFAQGCGPTNPNCTVVTAPVGTSNNQAASTKFVQNALPGSIPLTSGQILIGNSSNFAQARAMSGDCAITNTGVLTCFGSSPLIVSRGGTGATSFTANLPILGNGTGSLVQGTRSGNTTSFATTSGTLPSGNCTKFDASGNFVDSGVVCGGGTSPWTNTRLAKSANYTVASADCGSTLALGGSTYFTLTLSAASGYIATCAFYIVNEDTGRGKKIAINGATAFILWPGQVLVVFNSNNVWDFNAPGPWKTLSVPTFAVNHASGDNTTDCLGSGATACATICGAVQIVQNQVNKNGFQPVIQNVDETFTENNCFVTGRGTGNVGVADNQDFKIVGNDATPANVVWQVSSGAGLIADNASFRVEGFKFLGTGGNNALQAEKYGIITFLNTEFSTFTSGYHIVLFEYGSVYFDGGTYVISGNMINHVNCSTTGHYIAATISTVSLPNALTFTDFFSASGSGCSYQVNMTYSGTGSGAGSTGRQWNIVNNASLGKAGSTVPGATAGATGNGGVVF